jgi:hypothetical protein
MLIHRAFGEGSSEFFQPELFFFEVDDQFFDLSAVVPEFQLQLSRRVVSSHGALCRLAFRKGRRT